MHNWLYSGSTYPLNASCATLINREELEHAATWDKQTDHHIVAIYHTFRIKMSSSPPGEISSHLSWGATIYQEKFKPASNLLPNNTNTTM